MRLLFQSGIVAIVVLISGCATTDPDPYRFVITFDEYATIEDDPPRGMGTRPWVRIESIDRNVVDNESRLFSETESAEGDNERGVIPITGGEHQIFVVAGGRYFRWNDIWGFPSPFGSNYYSRTVILFEAGYGGRYRVQAVLDREGDYADFWIEDAESRSMVTEKIRVNGLNRVP